MIAWLRHHRLSLALAVARLARTPAATLFNVLAIGTALALPVGGYCVLARLEALAGTASTEPQMSIFLVPGARRNDATDLESRIRQLPGVKSVRFVARDAALATLKSDPGMAAVIATLSDNPLPDAFVVGLDRSDVELSGTLERELRSLPKVAHVQVDTQWTQRLDALLRLGRTALLVLAALLGTALIAVTFNTIRLQILTHTEEIEISALVGATTSYIRRPFLYLGSVLGGLGGGAAIAIVWSALLVLNRDVASVMVFYGPGQAVDFPSGAVMITLAAATILGWLGSVLSVSTHLRRIH